MRSSKSPFKRKSHSRETSHDENTSFFHKRTISGSSAHHSRNVSQGAVPSSAPPVSGGNYSHKRNVSRASNSSQTSNFLAEQYERDRKAIINCCFSRPDHKTGGAEEGTAPMKLLAWQGQTRLLQRLSRLILLQKSFAVISRIWKF